MMIVDFEDFLETEVFDQNGGMIGSFECFWTDEDAQAQFLGIKLSCAPGRTCVVPVTLVTADDRQSCIRVHALDKEVAGAPSLDCDEQLEQSFEQKVYIHFRLSAPARRHQLHVNRSH